MDITPDGNKELIKAEDIIKSANLKGFTAKSTSELVMSIFKFNQINRLYKKHKDETGISFVNNVLEDLALQYEIPSSDFVNIPQTGPFIMVSNHPYGGVEGLILLKEVQKVRTDLKVIGNFLFQKVEPLKDLILPVNPFENVDNKSSIKGLKIALKHLANGSPVLIFPAGEVSTWYNDFDGIADRKWMKSAVKFIQKAEVPVIPIYFQGSNSFLFHSLGFIHPILRTAKIPSELLNKKNKNIKIRIGSPIPVKEQLKYSNAERFGRYLRAKTYLLGTSIEVKKFFKPMYTFPVKEEEIVLAVEQNRLKLEISNLPNEYLLFKQANYHVFCAPPYLIPNIINELGRLREITFRAVGEGTNMKQDIDEYDLYYHHLFIWDEDTSCIAGAYRIGMGKEILYKYGVKGFYVQSLFKMKKSMHDILKQSLELGRSFIVKEYQRNPLPLYLLWKGILHFLIINPEYRYLIGPVSISNNFTEISKSIIVDFIQKNHFEKTIATFIKPKKRFRPSFAGIDTDVLTEKMNTLKELDNLIKDIEVNGTRVPVLLKKYLELNGKIIGFNVDPKFNHCLDGLLLLDLQNVPEETIYMLSKEMDRTFIAQRLKHIDPVVLEYAELSSIPQY